METQAVQDVADKTENPSLEQFPRRKIRKVSASTSKSEKKNRP